MEQLTEMNKESLQIDKKSESCQAKNSNDDEKKCVNCWNQLEGFKKEPDSQPFEVKMAKPDFNIKLSSNNVKLDELINLLQE